MSDGYDYDLVCIGSGPAGQRAAVQAAKLGHRAAVIERRKLGGVSLFSGTIPSKTFREAVLFAASLGGRFDRREHRRASRPTVRQLLELVQEVVEREAEVVERQLSRNDVATIQGVASFADPHTLVVDTGADGTRTIRARNVLIAVGTRPAQPPGIEFGTRTVITSDGVLQMEDLPRTMTVVGAGVIGIEYASMFAKLGVDVTLVDGRERPLEFVDREIIDYLIHCMRTESVTFRLGEKVAKLEERVRGSKPCAVVELESGKRIVSELVLFSIGRVGATDKLNLAAAGLEADARGRLAVDDCFRTTVPHIFAAGDVIGYPALAATSSAQGRRAACHALGYKTDRLDPHLPVGIYAIPEISMVGETEQQLTDRKVPYETGIARYREIARGAILGDESGLFKMLFHRDTRKLLGVHIIGTQATELVHIGQAVMRLDAGLDYFRETVFNYPTLAECYKVAALDAGNKLDLEKTPAALVEA